MRNAKNGPIRGKLDQTKILINENMMSNMKRINDNVYKKFKIKIIFLRP